MDNPKIIRWVHGTGRDADRFHVPVKKGDECADEHVMRIVADGHEWWLLGCTACDKTIRLRRLRS